MPQVVIACQCFFAAFANTDNSEHWFFAAAHNAGRQRRDIMLVTGFLQDRSQVFLRDGLNRLGILAGQLNRGAHHGAKD
jgi:hypothetical protein